MQVREIMTIDPACCLPDSSLQDVAHLMVENNCGCIPIIENRESLKPIGTITDRDIAVRSFVDGKNPLDMKAADIMSSDIITVTPNISIEECCKVMEDSQIRRVLVVDENNTCCGIVAQADVAQYATSKQIAEVIREISDSYDASITGESAGEETDRSFSDSQSLLNGKTFLKFIAGLGSGAALMYFLDPDRGRRRRALVGDQITSLTNEAQKTLTKKQHHLQNRAKGLWAETRKVVTGNAQASSRENEMRNRRNSMMEAGK